MSRKKKTPLNESVPPREKLKEIGALFLVLCAAFVFISLVTYDGRDIPGVHYPPSDPPLNKGGRLGADLAYGLLSTLGLAAYVLVFLAGFWSFLVFFRRRVQGLYLKLIAAGVTVFAAATLLSLQPVLTPSMFGLAGTAPGTGGLYGKALETVLAGNFGAAGALLFVLLSFAVSVVLATDWMIYTGAIRLWRGIAAVSREAHAYFSAEERIKRHAARQEKAREELVRIEREQPPTPKAEPVPASRPVPVRAAPAPSPSPKTARPLAPYEQPPLRLFDSRVERLHGVSVADIKQRMIVIEQTLKEFGIDVRVVNYEIGPAVTIYELELSHGTPIHKVVARQDEISMRLAVPPVRIVGPIPGKNTVGVEVANPYANTVRIREFLDRDAEGLRRIPLPVLLGKTNAGKEITTSLTEMPHLLIGGTTGSGKSVCLKSIITSLVCARSWEEMKLILIDPKMVELSAFAEIPHLWAPVVTDSRKAAMVLEWLVREMEERYMLLNKVGSRNIEAYNNLGRKKLRERLEERGIAAEEAEEFPLTLPYIVVIIDELADLMMTARKEVEHSIIRISQKARAVGIHNVVATQRPSADVITGLIRSNMPSRIAFKVSTSIESRIILDAKGAERLLGKGDMLVHLQGGFQPVRAQCTFISDDELRGVVKFLKAKGKPVYHEELIEIEAVADLEGTAEDDLFEEAVQAVLMEQRGSTSMLQRKFRIGYNRAARLMDEMVRIGIVGKSSGSGVREVLLTPEQWEARKAASASG